MYMNIFQKYIKELLDEYGPLLKRQLHEMIKYKFRVNKESIDGYVKQMCIYADYEECEIDSWEIVLSKGDEVDFDVIRSFEVMLKFLGDLTQHSKGKEYVSVRFWVKVVKNDDIEEVTHNNEKDICIIPVHIGTEKEICLYAEEKVSCEKSEIIIFLLDSIEQIEKINAECNHKFATLGKNGVNFYAK